VRSLRHPWPLGFMPGCPARHPSGQCQSAPGGLVRQSLPGQALPERRFSVELTFLANQENLQPTSKNSVIPERKPESSDKDVRLVVSRELRRSAPVVATYRPWPGFRLPRRNDG
jgi:hypothetical protein